MVLAPLFFVFLCHCEKRKAREKRERTDRRVCICMFSLFPFAAAAAIQLVTYAFFVAFLLQALLISPAII